MSGVSLLKYVGLLQKETSGVLSSGDILSPTLSFRHSVLLDSLVTRQRVNLMTSVFFLQH